MSHVRLPAVAGMFYYFDPEHLKDQLSNLFSDVKARPECLGVVSPHAGYQYSGKTAAWAISSLKHIKKFIIMGPNHGILGPEFSIMSSGIWKTPLGDVKIDTELGRELKKCSVLKEDMFAHSQEHSIEVQLPFLQYRFKKFTFVPISISNTDYSEDFLNRCESLGKFMAGLAKKQSFGIVVSSDFSHYLPLKIANKKDEQAIKHIKDLDTKAFFQTLEKTGASICGYGPIAVMMEMARGLKLKAGLVHRTSSGDATGDYDSVVTYYAIGFA